MFVEHLAAWLLNRIFNYNYTYTSSIPITLQCCKVSRKWAGNGQLTFQLTLAVQLVKRCVSVLSKLGCLKIIAWVALPVNIPSTQPIGSLLPWLWQVFLDLWSVLGFGLLNKIETSNHSCALARISLYSYFKVYLEFHKRLWMTNELTAVLILLYTFSQESLTTPQGRAAGL